MLRPVSFSIPSSTELKVTFNDEVTELLGQENFLVESVSGNIDNLEVTKVTVEEKYVIVTTRPQVAGNYYILKLLDADDVPFVSISGTPLINDDVSRELYFVGLKNHNPVRDRMILSVPKLYDLENTNINNLITAQSEEIFQAQKDLGETLSDNYISTDVVDEQRTRSSGATDRLSNEGVYSVVRVSSKPTTGFLTFTSLEYNDDSEIDRHDSIPDYPISLQEIYVEEEEISLSSEDNWFKGFLLSLSNKNVIKLISLKHIKSTDEEDCDNEIGTDYKVSLYKYSIYNNRYDPLYSFSNVELNDNEVLLSEFGNVEEPTVGDTIIVSYLYRDTGIKVNERSIEVYNLEEVESESIPTNTARFFLENAPIVDSENEIPEKDGIAFKTGENLTDTPDEFQRELVFNASKLPSKVGEFTVNYATGEVIVVGAEEIGAGTGSNNNIAEYLYRNSFTRNLDFYVKDDEFVAASSRSIVGEGVNVDFNYDKVYVEDIDYRAPCHTEVFNEHVENKFVSSFIISPQNTPVTNVFRIFNQTTGEVYSPLYNTKDEIYFTGSRSPEFKTESNELAKFDIIELERLEPIGEFVCPTFSVKITANESNSNIQFSPGIPAELINQNSQDYFIRSAGLDGSDDIEDLQIRFFGTTDSNNLISSVSISSTATAPSLKESVTIGPKGLAFSLDNNYIINKAGDSVGSYVNTSVEFTKADLFAREKYFQEISSNPGVSRTEDDSLTAEILSSKGEDFYDNLSRLRKVGDYTIDYKHGQIYLAVAYDQDYQLGYINYNYNSITPLNVNIISITEASKKLVSSDALDDASKLYGEPSNSSTNISILDLESTILLPDGETTAIDFDGNLQDICVVLDDFTVVLPMKISEVNGIYSTGSLEGARLSYEKESSRLEDLGSDTIGELVENGGGNIFDSTFMSFEDNVIDFKKSYSTRLLTSGDDYTITVNDSEFDEIYKIIHTPTETEIFGEKLNVIKIDDLEIVSAGGESGGEVVVEIRSGPILDSIDTDGDFLLDAGGSRFVITDFDADLSSITVSVPAENNVEADSPDLGDAQVIVKATVEESSSGMVITVPADSYVNSGDPVEVIYKTTSVPSIGTKVGVDFRFGRLYLSYTYSYDDIYISYEYGDNEIDWSISSSVSEGETYFVTYKYGALREALKRNFGILTKIPFFQRFSINTDRELYRSALAGTMQAFTKGPTVPAFKGLVSSFTDISPEITESVFGSWILGRDYLHPGTLDAEGTLEFKSCKFEEGVMINDDTVITAPALSNLNLNEGTLSAWVCPEWAGIDNDATLTIDMDNIGEKQYVYKLGSNPFSYDNGFSVLASDHFMGGTDYSLPSITIHNYTSSWVDKEGGEEEETIGAFALVKQEESISRIVKTEVDISLKVSSFSAPTAINPPRRRPSEDVALSRAGLGILGLGRSISDASRGLVTEGSEMDLFRFCSPAFISMGDANKLLFMLFSLRPLYNPHNGRIYTFRVGDEHIEKNEIPTYDRLHVTRNCKCTINNTISDLSKFRDKDFQSITVDLDFDIPFSYISDVDVAFDDRPSSFRLLDTRGAIYEVYAFLDDAGQTVEDRIPDTVSGFIINRIPDNQQHITSQGSDAINNLLPTGEITVLYQSVSILTNENPESEKYLDYKPKNYIVDWMSDFVDISLLRDPLNNNVEISIKSAIKSDKQHIKLFYTDLIGVEKEEAIYEVLNFDKWFNVVEGITSVDNSSDLGNKIAVGTLDITTKSIIDIGKLNYTIHNRFDESDVYIGASARSPKRIPFEVNKGDFPSTSVGLPYNSDVAEGVFIGFDELCLSPLAEDAGQWVFRTRASSSISAPTGVCEAAGDSEKPYELVFSDIPIDHTFSGTINTDGEFSSVVRAHREEDGSGCPTGLVCSSEFRYCGDSILDGKEQGNGWRKLNETDSDLINILLGGSEAESSVWMKHGAFDTILSGGVYRMGPSVNDIENCNHDESDGNFVYTSLPCYGGDYSATVSFKVSELDYDILSSSSGRFEGAVSGVMTGIVPVHIYDDSLNIKLALAISDIGQTLVLVLDGRSNNIIDIAYLDWDNGVFNQLTLTKDFKNEIITIQSDTYVLSRLSFDDFSSSDVDECSLLSEAFFAIHLADGELIDISEFHDEYSGNILDIGLIEYSGRHEDGVTTLEDGDIFISTDSKIEFSLTVVGSGDEDDGYVDAYMDCDTDGYVDAYGYASESEYDVDEIYFTSDKVRYLFDSGEGDSENRISIFKDGKGFMNFRIYDNSLSLRGDVNMYNIATNIKEFQPGELHHIAASWRLNTLYEKDEMHLFVDGLEAPNIYKFGGPVPVRINDKFSDVSKETLQDFLVDNIEFCDVYTNAQILAGSSTFTSSEAGFTQDMVGRSIIFLESDIATTYVGKEYIINSVDGDDVTFVRGLSLDTVTFETSASDVKFMLPPTAGIKSDIATDFRNSSFAVFKTDCAGEKTELGGVLYTVDSGTISIISGENVINPQYRVNIATKVIEFVGEDSDCSFVSSVDFSDLDIHIETFGLIYANCNDIISLSGSSYYRLDKKAYDVNSGKSVILAHAAEPVSLEDVFIKRIVLSRMIPSLDSIVEEDSLYKTTFEVDLENDDGHHLLMGQTGQVYSKNLGRYLTINFDSDNTAFCEKDIDGYIEDTYTNKIKIYGETIDGTDEEIFSIRGNGAIKGKKLFKNVTKMVGEIYIADPDYEPYVVEVVETNPITTSDNDGEYAEVFKYTNGSLILTTAGSNGFYPFELHPGDYQLNYPAFLNIKIPRIGDNLQIGCDKDGAGQFGGTIDEFRIITEMSSDTRPTQSDTDGTRSVTKDYLNPNPHCPDDQTLTLIHFDDPIALQSRRLRQKEFLNTESNFKFKLDLEDRERLLKHINDEDMFVSNMVRMGYDKDTAIEAFIECHHAEGGPLFNETRLLRSDDMIVSENSVNDNFGLSARFFNTQPLVVNNRHSYFRRKEGTIEFWISPLLDTIGDEVERYYLDIYSATRKRVKSFSPTIVDLPTPAREVVGIQLMQKTQEFSEFYSQDEIDQILFDEIYRSEITGRLTGGTGIEKDFSIGSKLSADGKRVFLTDALPGSNVDIIISYIPLDSSGDRVSIYKNERSQIVFSIIANGSTNIICKDIDWSRNTWHRIMCTYRTNSISDTMRLFVDGVDSGYITYGQEGVVYGTGFVYGQTTQQEGASRQIDYNIKLGDDFRLICIGSDVFEKRSALSRLDNIRFSRTMRSTFKDPAGDYIDPNYSSNTDTIMPVVRDDATTLVLNFEQESEEDFYATVVDPSKGIFNFDIEVADDFGKIDSEEVEDLIVELVNRLKPAHSNALIKFPREPC